MQFGLVAALDAELADVVSALVIDHQVVGFNALQVGVIDAANVANGVGRDFTERVIAEQPRTDLETRKAKTIHRKACNFFVAQPVAQGQRLEILAVFEQPLETPPITWLDIDDIRQRIKCGIQIFHL